MKQITTLVLVFQGNKILLGMKKRDFGAGRWNGFGGKVNDGEGIEQAAKRELLEESGIEAEEIEQFATIIFNYLHKDKIVETHLFKVTKWQGKPTESDEMLPQWFDQDQLPFEQMWPDDKYWVPYFLKNRKFVANFIFKDYEIILRHEITEVEQFTPTPK